MARLGGGLFGCWDALLRLIPIAVVLAPVLAVLLLVLLVLAGAELARRWCWPSA